MVKKLSQDEINLILSTSRSRGPKQDPTEPREIGTWFKLNQIIREEGCENPDCIDPREKTNTGTRVVSLVKGKHMCRYCFLAGWLSDAPTAVI